MGTKGGSGKERVDDTIFGGRSLAVHRLFILFTKGPRTAKV